MASITQEQFEAAYAQRSGMTVEELHDLGLYGKPCRCGEPECQGWQMTSATREAD